MIASYHTLPEKEKATTESTSAPDQPSNSPAPQSAEPSQAPEPTPSPTADNENITIDNIPNSIGADHNRRIIAEIVDYNRTQQPIHLKSIAASTR